MFLFFLLLISGNFLKSENNYEYKYQFKPDNGFRYDKNYILCLESLKDVGTVVDVRDSKGDYYSFAVEADKAYCYDIGGINKGYNIMTNKEIGDSNIVLMTESIGKKLLNNKKENYLDTREVISVKGYSFNEVGNVVSTPTGSTIGLKPGTCNVVVIPGLPDVDSYNTNSINNLRNNSQYITNVHINTYKATIEFVNPKPSEDEKFYWDFLEPLANNNYCWSNNNLNVKLAYVSSINKYKDKEVSYTLYIKDPETNTYVCVGGDCSNTNKANTKLEESSDGFYTISNVFEDNINTNSLTGKFNGKTIDEILDLLSEGGSKVPMVGTASQTSLQMKLVVSIHGTKGNNKNIITHSVEFLVSKCSNLASNQNSENNSNKNNGKNSGNGGNGNGETYDMGYNNN